MKSLPVHKFASWTALRVGSKVDLLGPLLKERDHEIISSTLP